MLELEDGWTGHVALPWMVWEVYGTGEVGIEGVAFQIGSSELNERLQKASAPITSLDVYTGAGVRIVFFINGVRLAIQESTDVTVRGLDVWAVEAWFATHPEGGVRFAGEGAAVSQLPVTVE